MNQCEGEREDHVSVVNRRFVEDVTKQDSDLAHSLGDNQATPFDPVGDGSNHSRRSEDENNDSVRDHKYNKPEKMWEIATENSVSLDVDSEITLKERDPRVDLDSDESSPDVEGAFDYYWNMYQYSDSSSEEEDNDDDDIEGYDVTQKIEVTFDEEVEQHLLVSALAKPKNKANDNVSSPLTKNVSFRTPLCDVIHEEEKTKVEAMAEVINDVTPGSANKHDLLAVTEQAKTGDEQETVDSNKNKQFITGLADNQRTANEVIVLEDVFAVETNMAEEEEKRESDLPRVATRMKRYLDNHADTELMQLVSASKKRTRPSLENAFTPPVSAEISENSPAKSSSKICDEQQESSSEKNNIPSSESLSGSNGVKEAPSNENEFLADDSEITNNLLKAELKIVEEIKQLAESQVTFQSTSESPLSILSHTQNSDTIVATEGSTAANLPEDNGAANLPTGNAVANLFDSTAESSTVEKRKEETVTEASALLAGKSSDDNNVTELDEAAHAGNTTQPKPEAGSSFKGFVFRALRYFLCCNFSPSSYISWLGQIG